MKIQNQKLSAYSFCIIVSAALIVLLALSVDFFVSKINTILSPCVNDGVYMQDSETCNCDNTKGIWSGETCNECMCDNNGLCVMGGNGASDTRFECFCPSHTKFVGILCDDCYTRSHASDPTQCKGVCLDDYYGGKCNNLCLPNGTASDPGECERIKAGGGSCSLCNSHGSCDNSGQCVCDSGYFNGRGSVSDQCGMTCEGGCPSDRGECKSVGSSLQCFCFDGFFGKNCEQSCKSNNTLPCSGHGTCEILASSGLQCICDAHYTGEDCMIRCPGRDVISEPCSGHGLCSQDTDTTAKCTCTNPWGNFECGCVDEFICSGHGTCNLDYDGLPEDTLFATDPRSPKICNCMDGVIDGEERHYGGTNCARCKDNWFGSRCNLYCDPHGQNDDLGVSIGCNGHGACFLNTVDVIETVECECLANYDVVNLAGIGQCSQCEANYFPKVGVANTTAEFCSTVCSRDNECSFKGDCNYDYDGSNNICTCDLNGVNQTFDTLDPTVGCSACLPNWYPKDLDEISTRCTSYCAADGFIGSAASANTIVFDGIDLTLRGETEAYKVCTANSEGFETNGRCHVCSDAGRCSAEGTCSCGDGTTGDFCQIDCGVGGRAACSGHGRCIRDSLEMWFNPFTNNFRCECLPYDTYTAETRTRLISQGFVVPPAPAAKYHGKHCNFHCPTYNSAVCADRGECDVEIALNTDGVVVSCTDDSQCLSVPGQNRNGTEDAFCAVLATPWDSLVPQFFAASSGSPGYTQCTSVDGGSCIDMIYSVDWGDFCVQVLNGWYPNELNTANCGFNVDYRDAAEIYFIEEDIDGKTWCDRAMEALTPQATTSCSLTSYPDQDEFEASVSLCYSQTLSSKCLQTPQCIYDQTLVYMQITDEFCAEGSDCTGPCELDSNGVCSTKTYCRAKTCPDAIQETSLESLCFDSDESCKNVPNIEAECSKGMNNIRDQMVTSSLDGMDASVDLFFSCWMHSNKDNPWLVEDSVPGDIKLTGSLTVMGRSVLVKEYLSGFLSDRISEPNDCPWITFDSKTSTFCEKHLSSVVSDSSWYQSETAGWYNPWRLKCGDYISLWATETEANSMQTDVYRATGIDCSVLEAGSNPEEMVPWTLECLLDDEENVFTPYVSMESILPSPYANNGCTLKEHPTDRKWGTKQWTHHEIEQHFQETCIRASTSPAIPAVPDVPDFCDIDNPCGSLDECTPCSTPNCNYVECKNFNARPVCDSNAQGGVYCGGATTCSSVDTPDFVYTCSYSANEVSDYKTIREPILEMHAKYREINWLEYCADTVSTDMDIKQASALSSEWGASTIQIGTENYQVSEAHWVNGSVVLFERATLECTVFPCGVSFTVFNSSDNALLVVKCPSSTSVYPVLNETDVVVTENCLFEMFGTVLITEVTVNLVETLLDNVLVELEQWDVNPPALRAYLSFGEHPQTKLFDQEQMVTFQKTPAYIDANSGADDTMGMQHFFDPVQDNIRVSGWIWLTGIGSATIRLLSVEEKTVVEMTISDTELSMEGELEEIESTGGWIQWYIEARYVNETQTTSFGSTEHLQVWQATAFAGGQSITTHVEHTSLSRTISHLGRMAHSFHNVPSLTEGECHSTCDGHDNCLQYSHTKADNHCYLYSKRCHEDDSCVHGTHTLKSLHGHHIQSFVMDTDSVTPVTFAHVKQNSIVIKPDPADFTFENSTYKPDVTTVCNDLAATFHMLPGYETHVCHDRDCTPLYNGKDMGMCGQFLKYKTPASLECGKSLNWTSYCYYHKSFDKLPLSDYYPVLDASSVDDFDTLCSSSNTFRTDVSGTCADVTQGWFKQCLDRMGVYKDFCDQDCLNYVETQLSSSVADPSICDKRKEFLKLNITGDPQKDKECSENVERLVITNFCSLQNAYHEEDRIKIPQLYSACSNNCREMLGDEFNRSQWRTWCGELASGTIEGVCSRTSCDCNVEDNIGVAGTFCELTCPSGAENGIEVACSGKNGRCFAEDFSLISADYTAQETALEFRNDIVVEKISIPFDYKPVWLTGPSPSATGVCQCAIGSGANCAVPCGNCNNGTYGEAMSSQYGLCDSYYGLCRTLPPFMRYNVKKVLETGATPQYNSTMFDGMEWLDPTVFLYADDIVMLEEAVLDSYDLTGASHQMASPILPLSFGQQQSVVNVLKIFPTICTENGYYMEPKENSDIPYDYKPWINGVDYMNNDQQITNNGVRMSPNSYSLLKVSDIPAWGACTPVQMSEDLQLCFSQGQMFATWDGTPLLVLARGELPPREGMTFAKASVNTVYAFGGTNNYDFVSAALSQTLYKISVAQQDWVNVDQTTEVETDTKIIIVEWIPISTSGSKPMKQRDAPIWFFYNELFVLSHEGDDANGQPEYTMFSLPFTLDGTRPRWIKYEKAPYSGTLVNMIASPNDDTNRLYTYIGSDVVAFTKEDGFYETAVYPAIPNSILARVPGQSASTLTCALQVFNNTNEFGNNTNQWQFKISGQVLTEYTREPDSVFLYLEEWLNIDVTATDPYQRFFNTIQWRTQPKLRFEDFPGYLDDAMNKLETLYMQQARWNQADMLYKKSILYTNHDRNDVQMIEPGIASNPTDEFLSIIRTNDGNLFSTEMATAMAEEGETVLIVQTEGEDYSRDMIVSGHMREFVLAGTTYPHTEELQFQTGIIEVTVQLWNEEMIEIQLRLQDSDQIEITWLEKSKVLSFYLVVHLEEWMYNTNNDFSVEDVAPGKTGWEALFNLFVSRHPEPTYHMKRQTYDFYKYYGSHCTDSADEACPGMLAYTKMPCSGRGRCSALCACQCEAAPSILMANEDTTNYPEDWQQSPFRGDGCELTCPGYDGENLNTICSGHPEACMRDGTCACNPGRVGDACQFKCPFTLEEGKEIPCSNNGGCGTKAITMNSTIFTRDIYNNRLAAMHVSTYTAALKSYYGNCDNYIETTGAFVGASEFLDDGGLQIGFPGYDYAKAYCEQINSDYAPDLAVYETHLSDAGKCIGLRKSGSRYIPIQLDPTPATQPFNMEAVKLMFKCKFSDCVLARHEDDKRVLRNVDTFTEAPLFEFHGQYHHGASGGSIQYLLNGNKIHLNMIWDTERLKVTLRQDESSTEHTIIDSAGEYRMFVIYVSSVTAVKTVLYKANQYENGNDNIFIIPKYGVNYQRMIDPTTGYTFNPLSVDTGADEPLMDMVSSQTACDAEEDCVGIIRWTNRNRKTWFSLQSFKSAVGAATMYPLDEETAEYVQFRKMSLVYQGKDGADTSADCEVVASRQATYPMIQYNYDYNIPVKNIDFSSVTDTETGGIIIGAGVWSRCWTKLSATSKLACKQLCESRGEAGFAWSESNAQPTCLCYGFDSKAVALNKYSSDDAKSIHNPCDAFYGRVNDPVTTWLDLADPQ